MLEYRNVKMIDCNDLDRLVRETYGKPYTLQQQGGCQERGVFNVTVPCSWAKHEDDDMHDSIREVVNGNEMGVKFAVWLARDPQEPLKDDPNANKAWSIDLFWDRNFYPHLSMVLNDLHEKGLIEAGDYSIEIDW